MDDFVMNYIDDDDLTEEEYNSGFYNGNLKVDPDQFLTENKDVQNGLYSFNNQLQDSKASNQFQQNLGQGNISATTDEEKTSQKEEILPPIDALSSIVIVKVETVMDTPCDSSTFNAPLKEEFPCETLNGATNDDIKKITFKCDVCFFIGTSRFALARHKETCKAVEPLIVPELSEKLEEEKYFALARHEEKCKAVEPLLVTELSEKLEDGKYSKAVTFNCNVCDFSATSRFALARHKNKHQNNEVEDKRIIFDCEFCPFSASSRFALARHQEEHVDVKEEKFNNSLLEEKCVPVETTNQMIPKMRVFKCRWCQFTSKFRFALKRHALRHRKPDTFTCPRCFNLVLTVSKSEHLLKCKKKCEHFTCDNCPYKTIYKKMFMNHQSTCKKELSTLDVPATIQHQTSEKNESNQKCKYCPFTTKFSSTLNKHLESHKAVQPLLKYPKVLATDKQHQTTVQSESHFQCKYCSFSAKFLCNLTNHLKAHSLGKPIFKCRHCSYRSTYSAVKTHNQTNPACYLKNDVGIDRRRSKELLKCDQCTFKTSWLPAWHKHRISHRRQKTEKSEIIKCPECPFRTHQKTTFENHLRSHEHNNVRTRNTITECKEGPSNTELMAASDTHEKSEVFQVGSENANNTTKDDQSAQNSNIEYKCKFCSVTLTRLHSWRIHIGKHKKLPVYKCDKCNFTGFKCSVGKHMKIEHKNEKFLEQTRAICHRMKAENLKRHRRTHEGKKIKTLPRDTHINGLKKFCCELCSYSAITKNQLILHQKMHIKNDKPIVQCTLCDYKSFPHQLTRHYRNVHNKVKFNKQAMHYCKICSFSSKFKASVHLHTQNQHTLRKCDMYECDYCEFYSTKYSLRVHVAKVHRQAKDSSCD
ncbi:unnamed protein product [Ceutorhynchus assimilis]|uniref:C2H2-type domain-containing protein n=1 Tax=Ceutorhynchus assimilis TaxID=467358 RepID=A0A9N9QRD2_9CUCU|nr:unnamed protein product [Ceutorhynchus assimilis]